MALSKRHGGPDLNALLLVFHRAAWEREVYLSDQVESFKQHFIEHIPRTLMEKALGNCLQSLSNWVI